MKRLKDPIDLVFLDADKEGYDLGPAGALPLVRPGGLIAADNVAMAPDYIKAVTTDPQLDTVFFGRFAVTLKKPLARATGFHGRRRLHGKRLGTLRAPSALERRLGPLDAAAVVVSNVIGGGIFFVPQIVAGLVPNPWAILGVWLLGGLLSFAGAMAYAELAAARRGPAPSMSTCATRSAGSRRS